MSKRHNQTLDKQIALLYQSYTRCSLPRVCIVGYVTFPLILCNWTTKCTAFGRKKVKSGHSHKNRRYLSVGCATSELLQCCPIPLLSKKKFTKCTQLEQLFCLCLVFDKTVIKLDPFKPMLDCS